MICCSSCSFLSKDIFYFTSNEDDLASSQGEGLTPCSCCSVIYHKSKIDQQTLIKISVGLLEGWYILDAFCGNFLQFLAMLVEKLEG